MPGNGDHAQARRDASRTTGNGTHAAARDGTFGAVILTVTVLVMLGIDVSAARLVPAIGIAGHDTDVAVTQSGNLEFADGKFGGGIVAVNACDCLGHFVSL